MPKIGNKKIICVKPKQAKLSEKDYQPHKTTKETKGTKETKENKMHLPGLVRNKKSPLKHRNTRQSK